MNYVSLCILLFTPFISHSAENDITMETFTKEKGETGTLFKMTGMRFDEPFHATLVINSENYSSEHEGENAFGSSSGKLWLLKEISRNGSPAIDAYMYRQRNEAIPIDGNNGPMSNLSTHSASEFFSYFANIILSYYDDPL